MLGSVGGLEGDVFAVRGGFDGADEGIDVGALDENDVSLGKENGGDEEKDEDE